MKLTFTHKVHGNKTSIVVLPELNVVTLRACIDSAMRQLRKQTNLNISPLNIVVSIEKE